ncbi:hypothetical protein GGU11DRAFT_760388 [Lentinula aff. detonsa]|nr:hypothetical protein GGU11DRAFT_760388 [Lentinula aff. detonsa]
MPVSSSGQASSSEQASSSGQALSSGSQGDTSSSRAVSHPSPTVQPQMQPYLIQAPTFPPVDLLSDVVHTQVDQSAETITWPNGWESVLPIGMKNSVNVLKADVERVQWLADPKNAVPTDWLSVKYLARKAYQDNKSLIEDIQYLNAHNYTVVVPGGVASNWKQFEKFDDLDPEFGLGISENLTLQMHNFHRLTTVSDFIKDANNPNVVGIILDVPTSRQSLPEPYHLLDESAAAFHTLFAPTWALLHHAGTYTNVHQDAGGYSVAGQVLGDCNDPQPKMWAIMTLKNPVAASQMPEKVAERMASICQFENQNNESNMHWDSMIWQDCEIELMYLRPGDFFFQPPGAVHLIYTPGHFYNYDSLHLTEWTRRIQHLQSNAVTNQDPAHVKEVLNMMMLNFPNKQGRCFYQRALAALCRMVLAENKYIHQQQAKLKVGNKLDQKVEAMAEIVTRICFEISLAPGDEQKGIVNALAKILEEIVSPKSNNLSRMFDKLKSKVTQNDEESGIQPQDTYNQKGQRSSQRQQFIDLEAQDSKEDYFTEPEDGSSDNEDWASAPPPPDHWVLNPKLVRTMIKVDIRGRTMDTLKKKDGIFVETISDKDGINPATEKGLMVVARNYPKHIGKLVRQIHHFYEEEKTEKNHCLMLMTINCSGPKETKGFEFLKMHPDDLEYVKETADERKWSTELLHEIRMDFTYSSVDVRPRVNP